MTMFVRRTSDRRSIHLTFFESGAHRILRMVQEHTPNGITVELPPGEGINCNWIEVRLEEGGLEVDLNIPGAPNAFQMKKMGW